MDVNPQSYVREQHKAKYLEIRKKFLFQYKMVENLRKELGQICALAGSVPVELQEDAPEDLSCEIGEGTTYIFEQIYFGKRSFEDIDWVTKVLQSKLSNEFIEKVKTIISKTGNQTDSKKTANLISAIFNND